MESTKEKFLSWDEIEKKVNGGDKLNPIDQLIYDQTPARPEEEDEFREQLYDALNYEPREE